MTERNWALFQNLYFTDKKVFAAKVLKKTSKTITFVLRPEQEDPTENKRNMDWLIADNLTEAEAKAIAVQTTASLDLHTQEVKASKAAHDARLRAIMADVIAK